MSLSSHQSWRGRGKAARPLRGLCARIAAIVLACLFGFVAGGAVEAAPLRCDDGLKAAFHPDANTTVIAVRPIAKGARLLAGWGRGAWIPVTTDLCLVKLMIGPGSTSEPDRAAPSWSAGIGIEVWLPAPDAWNKRIRNFGGGGWAGGPHRQADKIGSPPPAILAANLGFATASTDAGHEPEGDVSYAFLSNGKLNAESMNDFIKRSAVELAVKTKALVTAYYGRPPSFTYFEGGSTGGRQGLKIAQEHPELYDGYLIGYPGINAPRFGVAAVYPQILLRKELGFSSIDKNRIEAFLKKADAVSTRAVARCDKEGLGFLLDPFACNYDPLKDAGALCAGVTGDGVVGVGSDPSACVDRREAEVVNRIWYGQTSDGSWDPRQSAADRGGRRLGPKQIWWGPNKGAPLAPRVRNAYTDNLVQALGRVDMAADATATSFPPLRNGSTSVRNRWLDLSYADLAKASDEGMKSPIYSPYSTDRTDLSKLKASGAKILMHVGLADELIPPAGALHWYQTVAERMGGYESLTRYVRLYLIPSVLHYDAHPYIPGGDPNSVPVLRQIGEGSRENQDSQLFTALMEWVEGGKTPQQMVATSRDGRTSYPLCIYPKRTTWTGKGSSHAARNYRCL